MVATEVKVPQTDFQEVTGTERIIREAEGKEEVTEVEEVEEILKGIKKKIKKAKKKKLEAKVKTLKKLEEKISKKAAKTLKSLERGIAAGAKKKRKEALQAAIGRQKLLQAIASKQREGRPVNILRRVSDKIPSVFIDGKEEEFMERKKLSFFGKGGLI